MNPINSLLKFFGLEDLMEVYPKYLLNVQYFIDSDKDALSKYSSLRYIKDKLTSGDIQSIIDSDIDRGVSFFHCFCYLPEDVKSIYASSISHQKAMELMKGFMEASLETVPPHYNYPAYPSPLPFLPENILSVDDWHKLCSQNTEAIPQGLIPQNVLDDPRFWNNYADFLGKGNYPKNLLFHPSESFDESLFNYMPEALKSDFDVQIDLLSKGLMHPKNLDTEKLTKEVFLKFPSRHYKMIPEELKKLPEFVPLAENAIKADIASLIHIPVEVLNEEMVLQGIKNFKDQGKAERQDGNYPYTPLEFRDVMEYLPEHLQTVNIYKAAMEIYPESVGNINHAFPDILENISLEEIPERPKEKEAVQIETEKEKYLKTQLEKYDLDLREMRYIGAFDELMRGEMTSSLISLPLSVMDNTFHIPARLQLKEEKNGFALKLFPQKKSLYEELEKPFMGHTFSEKQKNNLFDTGNAGTLVSITDAKGEKKQVLVSVDKLTNDLVAVERKNVKIPPSFNGEKLTPKDKEKLLNGHATLKKDMQINGVTFYGMIQYNASRRRIELLERSLTIRKIKGVELTFDQQNELSNGKTILVSGLKDGAGEKYNAWIRLDSKDRRIVSAKELSPTLMKAQKEITPASKHQVQVDRNTKGFRKEENKYSEKPVLSGKQTPADVDEQHKRKVNKLKM